MELEGKPRLSELTASLHCRVPSGAIPTQKLQEERYLPFSTLE